MIRQIRFDEIDQFIDMTQVAFAVTYTEEEIAVKRKQVIPEHIWGFFVDDKLAARVAVLPMHIMLQGASFKMGGIAHVATYPELRRGGMVGKLMAHCLEVMKLNGQTVSMLNPFSFSFYRKYGWESFGDMTTHSINSEHLPRFKGVTGQVRRGGAGELAIIAQLYEQYAKRYNGMLIRDSDWWVSNVFKRKLGSLAIYTNESGEPQGYMLYTIRERRMRIHEFITLHADSRKGLWQYIANHDSIINTVELSAPTNDPTVMLFAEPGTVRREYYPYFMIRIVDIAEFVRQYPFEPVIAGETLWLNVKDEHAPWNEGCWKLEWQANGSIITELTDEGTIPTAHDGSNPDHTPGTCKVLSCDIQTLSTMLCGYQRPPALAELGRLTGSPLAVQLLERAIPRRVPQLLDMF